MNLNDEVFLKRLKENVEYLRHECHQMFRPSMKPESIEEYKSKLEKYQRFSHTVYERVREMQAILELVEPDYFNKVARVADELVEGLRENPPWGMSPPPYPVGTATMGKPMYKPEKVDKEEQEE